MSAELLAMNLKTGTRIRVVIPWPTEPTMTPGGKVSTAKKAGKNIPWLSANKLHGMAYVPPGEKAKPFAQQLIQRYKRAWRDAAVEAVGSDDDRLSNLQLQHEVEIEAQLHRTHHSVMDPSGIIEGLKPIVDGLVAAGLLRGDRLGDVSYSRHSRVYPCPKGDPERVEIVLRRPAV